MATTRQTGSIGHDGESIYFELIRNERRDASAASLEANERDHVIVLSHGLGGNHASWYQQVGPLTAAGYDVLTWGQRGFGGSSRRSGEIGPAVAVGDLLALLDHLDLERCHLVGQSMGGWTAMGFALGYADRLASLTLTDTLAGVMTDAVRSALTSDGVAQRAAVADGALADHPALGERFCRDHPDRALLYQQLASFGDKPDDADVIGLLMTTWFDLDAVAALSLPVLGIVGADDHLCPRAAMEAVVDAVSGASLTVVDGAGHSPYFEAPAAWNQALLDFLKTLSARN